MKYYRGRRDEAGNTASEVVVEVRDGSGPWLPLTHHVRHSPTGFNWGYVGSGPADLARSILAEQYARPADSIPPGTYQEFKFRVVAMWGDTWEITGEEIDDAMRSLGKDIVEGYRTTQRTDIAPDEGEMLGADLDKKKWQV